MLINLFRDTEPTKCVLQIVPPILSLSSITILKSSLLMVLRVLVIYLVRF